jgi:hypothetical protein
VDRRVAGLHCNLNVIQASLNKPVNEDRIREPTAIGVEAGDLPAALCMCNEVGQVIPKSGFATGEYDVGNTELPEAI